MTKGDNCDACNALKNRTFPISQAKPGENLAPLHPNRDCKTGILDEDGNIAFYLEDVLDKLTETFDFSENKDNASINKLIEEIQQKFAQLFDFSKPWERRYEENNHKDFVKEISEEEVLFLSKLQMIGVPFDIALEITYEMRRTGGNIPKEKYEEWGFADSYSIGYVELQYKLTQEGMTIEQMDFLASNASLLAALDISLYNLAAASVSVAGTGIVSDKFNKINEKLKPSGETKKVSIPENARKVANEIKLKNGTPPQGYKGGKVYNNQPVNGGQKLPEGVNYREYDINPYIKGQNRGTERIVIGDDGSVWYTDDHYQTFTKID